MTEIILKQINNEFIDLSKSEKFVAHYEKSNSYSKYIIDVEINSGIYEDDILAPLLTSDEETVVIDAGANVGLFALHVLPLASRIYCIEPTPVHLEVLEDVAQCFGASIVTCHDVALSSYNGECYFNEVENNTTENKISTESTGLKVRCSTLKTFFEENNIEAVDLLKLDIEGAEVELFFKDSTIYHTLQEKCRAVYIECHSVPVEMAIVKNMKIMGFEHAAAKRSSSHYFINPMEV